MRRKRRHFNEFSFFFWRDENGGMLKRCNLCTHASNLHRNCVPQ